MELLIDRILVVELKAVDRFTEVHISQALAYLKATGHSPRAARQFRCSCVDARRKAHRAEPPDDLRRGRREGHLAARKPEMTPLCPLRPLRPCSPLLFAST